MSHIHHLTVLLTICGLLENLAGCQGGVGRAHAVAPEVAPVQVAKPELAASELRPGSPVPDVPFVLQDGFQLRLPAMKGKTIAVFFCASYTDPACQRQAEALRDHFSELHDEQHVVILGVSPETSAAHQAYLTAKRMPFDFASDPDGQLALAFGIAGPRTAPQTFVVDRGGAIRAVWRGADPEAQVRDLLAIARE
jgi:peroxiredoxin Q/BCP